MRPKLKIEELDIAVSKITLNGTLSVPKRNALPEFASNINKDREQIEENKATMIILMKREQIIEKD